LEGKFVGIQTFHHLTFIHPTVNHGQSHLTFNDVDFSSREHFNTGHAITHTFNHLKVNNRDT